MDMQEYTTKPEEALNSFSEALRILDINTVNYMVDDMKAEIEAQKAEVAAQKAIIKELNASKNAEIEAQKTAIIKELNAAKNAEIATKDAIIKELKDTITSLQSTIDTLNANFENMRKELSTYKQ